MTKNAWKQKGKRHKASKMACLSGEDVHLSYYLINEFSIEHWTELAARLVYVQKEYPTANLRRDEGYLIFF